MTQEKVTDAVSSKVQVHCNYWRDMILLLLPAAILLKTWCPDYMIFCSSFWTLIQIHFMSQSLTQIYYFVATGDQNFAICLLFGDAKTVVDGAFSLVSHRCLNWKITCCLSPHKMVEQGWPKKNSPWKYSSVVFFFIAIQ